LYDVRVSGEIERRVFDLFDPRVRTRIRWFVRRSWRGTDLEAAIASALADIVHGRPVATAGSEAPPQTVENSVAETAPLHCRLYWLCPASRGLDISEGWHSGLKTCFIRYDLGLRRSLVAQGRS